MVKHLAIIFFYRSESFCRSESSVWVICRDLLSLYQMTKGYVCFTLRWEISCKMWPCIIRMLRVGYVFSQDGSGKGPLAVLLPFCSSKREEIAQIGVRYTVTYTTLITLTRWSNPHQTRPNPTQHSKIWIKNNIQNRSFFTEDYTMKYQIIF